MGIRLHWEEWEQRNELSQNQMELGEMGFGEWWNRDA